ncbi:MAG: sigma 54-interacting transcriptional regulator [Blastocatellia bacterium]|nr:sigma 54-interacting transcriptional regulator [Blastocatellia bacterium]
MIQFPLTSEQPPIRLAATSPTPWAATPKPEITTYVTPQTVIGMSTWAQEARSILHAHATHERPLVLIGERGTGRRFLARQIHHLSHRSRQPFIAIECQTLSPASLRSALLGLSATGLSTTGQGLLELARGGTLYLGGLQTCPEELSSLLAQLDLTNTLMPLPRPQSPPPLPHTTAIKASQYDVRLVFGLLPEDEFTTVQGYMAQADRLYVPPLRERAADVELLAEHFLVEFLQALGREPRALTSEARRRLRDYDWPGNIKELKNAMLYAVHHVQATPVGLPDLPPPLGKSDPTTPTSSLTELTQKNLSLQEAVEAYEKQIITEALRRTGGHQTRAAKLLGIKLSTLNMKLARFGIDARTLRFE